MIRQAGPGDDLKTNVQITTDKAVLDLDYIHRFLKQSYWARGIPKDVVKKSIEHAMCFGMFKDSRQIGFARVITDYTTFAYLADVFIDPEEQGNGYGTRLVREILNHRELTGIRRWHLITRDAQEFYRRLSFTDLANPVGHLEKYCKPDYLVDIN